MTVIDGMIGAAGAAVRKVKVRRGTAAAGLGALALTIAMAMPAVQADAGRSPTGFASEDGVEVEMLTGPTCTWDVAEDDDRHGYAPHENEACDEDDENWWQEAPVIAAGPSGELVLRWATDAQPLRVNTSVRNDDEQPAPAAVSLSGVSGDGCHETKNPCKLTHVDVNTGGITYIVEVEWGEAHSTKYAVTLKG